MPNEDQADDFFSGLVRATVRPTTALAQARGTFPTVAFSPLVAGLPADAEIRAQLREREAARGRETDELILNSSVEKELEGRKVLVN